MEIFDICVIGAGLAGSALCSAASRKGYTVALVERGPAPAGGASGNERGLISPYIGTTEGQIAAFYEASFNSIQAELGLFAKHLPSLNRCGALQFPSAHRPKKLISLIESGRLRTQDAVLMNPEDTRALLGFTAPTSLLYYPRAAIISPKELCAAWLQSSHHRSYFCHTATHLSKQNGYWVLETSGDTKTISAKNVVIANAFECTSISLSSWLRVVAVRGQIMTIKQPATMHTLQTALCYDGYALPYADRLLLGASYNHNDMDTTVRSDDNLDMIRRLEKWTGISVSLDDIEGRVSFRTSTHDRMPYVGPLPDYDTIKSLNPQWSRVAAHTLPVHNGLYVSVGHGSRGLLSAPLSAEIILNHIDQSVSVHDPLINPMRLILQMIKHEEFRAGT